MLITTGVIRMEAGKTGKHSRRKKKEKHLIGRRRGSSGAAWIMPFALAEENRHDPGSHSPRALQHMPPLSTGSCRCHLKQPRKGTAISSGYY